MKLRSPTSGRPLEPDTPHSLAAPGERWPVVDGIPYLRTDSEGLVAVALDHLDAGCPDDALVALLTDQDAWWTGPATDLTELKRLVRERDTLTLRDAMALLRMGPVADYFAYRWSDPTYLGGLALLEAYWNDPKTSFELACGIGHYARELTRRGVACTGADVVYAKCWLARYWVAPDAEYLVFDATAPWPLGDATFDLVQCHDAFYFLPDQEVMAERLRAAKASGGVLALSHVHNGGYLGPHLGPVIDPPKLRAMFPDADFHDEDFLLFALLRRHAPVPNGWDRTDTHPGVEAFGIAEGGSGTPRIIDGGMAMPVTGATLRPNPLLGEAWQREPSHANVVWPSKRYEDEYGRACFWGEPDDELVKLGSPDPVRLRRLVDLPERW